MNVAVVEKHEYNPYYQPYFDKMSGVELIEGLKEDHRDTLSFLDKLPENKLEYRYEEGKWTIKELLVHLLDAERIFAYRALRFARKDTTPLAGFEQDDYVRPSKANSRSLSSLRNEFNALRLANIELFKNMDDEMLREIGMASGSDMSSRAAAFMIIGHSRHHRQIIEERYL
ncbi:DinB family protein [Spongiivirga sp. MCCC 1A20706]|uniref:DinB family protein n=1 Tax=Spongiivirga sp. MCCC 1A20706 TaxID=3160963 RepID=UPI003977AA69